jgi:hypothetical protein
MSNIKNKDNLKKDNKKENELKLSVYDNIKEKIMDPHNIMGRDMVYGQIINDSQDFSFNNNGINNNNNNNFGSKEKLKEK